MKKYMYPLACLIVLLAACKKNKKNEPQPEAVAVTAFSPAAGLPGDIVTIQGAGFAAPKVYFGSLEARITAATATELKVEVPDGVAPARINVSAGGRSAASRDSFFLALPEAKFSWTTRYASPTEYVMSNQSRYADIWEWTINGTVVSTDKEPTGWMYAAGQYDVRLIAARRHRGVEYRDTADMALLVANDPALQAWYPFNMDLRDYANNHLASARRLTPCPDRKGNPDKAWRLNGIDEYIELPGNLFLSATHAMTVSFWVKVDDPDGLNGILGIQAEPVGRNMPPDKNLRGLYGMNGALGGSLGVGNTHRYNAPGLTAGWHHVAITADMMSQELYVDGHMKGMAGAPFAANFHPMPFMQLGAVYNVSAPGVWSYLKGDIDDVRIYNRKIMPNQVQALYAE